MKLFSKSYYKPRYFGYYIIRNIIEIIDALLTIFSGTLFNYECNIYFEFCRYNLIKDMRRGKRK